MPKRWQNAHEMQNALIIYYELRETQLYTNKWLTSQNQADFLLLLLNELDNPCVFVLRISKGALMIPLMNIWYIRC